MRRSLTFALRLLATVSMLITGAFSTVAIADASPTAQEAANGGIWSMGIGARTFDAQENFAHTVGAHFTVTTEDGDFVGECTLPEPPQPGIAWWNCRVDVPSDQVTYVWQDPDSIPAGYAPVENPITFDPTTYETGPHNIGAFFDNVLVDGGTATTTTANTGPETAKTRPLSIRSSSCSDAEQDCWAEVGAHFTVTTEDGDTIGECTQEASSTPNNPGCTVLVPFGGVVIITEEVDTITPDFAPRSNPIRFDTAVEPRTDCGDACIWGPVFVNGPVMESSRTTGAGDLVIWAGETDVGARVTVSTEGGDAIGECTLEGTVFGRTQCTVAIPLGTVVIVTEDESTIAPGLAPESNPIRFDTGVEPFTTCAPCHWGPEFRNGPKASASDTTDTASTTDATTSDSTRTWTASVQVMLCDAPPNSGTAMNCTAGAGVTVTISLASGELLGSCTTEAAQPTPWGTEISLCGVEGMPFNADFVATQDPSTIPAGYEPYEDAQTLHVADAYPGGGDQATFTFVNVRTGSSGNSTGTTGSDQSGSATLLMTFRACPEGFDPNSGDFWAECTIPLDAPDASIIVWGGDGQGGMSITQLARQDDGSYVYSAGPGTMNLQLSGLAPVVRDSYQVYGSDGGDGATYTVNLTDGETREIIIFYYFG